MNYLPSNCNWTKLHNDRQINQLLTEFDFTRRKFNERDCELKICDIQINNKPFYLYTCPGDHYTSKISQLLLTKDQINTLIQQNPYSPTYIRPDTVNESPDTLNESPDTVINSPSPLSFIKGGKKHKTKNTKQKTQNKKHKTKNTKQKTRKRKLKNYKFRK